MSRLSQSTDALNGTASRQFDDDGNPMAQIDAANNTLSVTYDLAGRLTNVTSTTGSHQYTYNQLATWQAAPMDADRPALIFMTMRDV